MKDLTFETVVNNLEKLFTSDECSELRVFFKMYSNNLFLKGLNKMLSAITDLINKKPIEEINRLNDDDNFTIAQGLAMLPFLMLRSVPDEKKHSEILDSILTLCDNYYHAFGEEKNQEMIDAVVKLVYIEDQYDRLIYLGNQLLERFEGIVNSDRNYYSYSQNFLDYLLKEDCNKNENKS